jgi:hypothetical protein
LTVRDFIDLVSKNSEDLDAELTAVVQVEHVRISAEVQGLQPDVSINGNPAICIAVVIE